jgi:PAS domain S-box-containing protein
MSTDTNRLPQRPEENFRLVVEAAPLGMILVDRSGAMLLVNPPVEKLFGYSREELLGQSIEMLVPVRFRDLHFQHRTGFFTTPQARLMGEGLDLHGLRKDGSEVPIEVGLSSLQTANDVYILVTVTDITARKREEKELARVNRDLIHEITQRRLVEEDLRRRTEELRRSNSELEQFAYVASHDLQEPLRMISSYLDLLGQRYRDKLDDKAERWIGIVVDGALRMKQLINDLLELSRVNTRGKPFVPVDSAAVLGQAVDPLRQAIQESAAVVSHGPLPLVRGDPSQLAQLFQNLIGNAIKYRGQQPPAIRVEALRNPDNWLFSVRDNGIGIDPQFHERIFVIFQRLHSRAEYPGTGTGLALCKKIVERHGGRIWVESQPAQGATFFFTLPCPEEPPHESR